MLLRWTAACLLVWTASISAQEHREDARIHKNESLDAVAMPVGGIGTGTVWVTGDGRLAVWQVFNNYDELPLPDTFLAIRVGGEGGGARVLQRGEGWGMPGFSDVTCVGEYPILHSTFRDAELPVTIDLESFNPMIPTNTKDSSLPCAIFSVRITNQSQEPVDVSPAFSVQNPIGYIGGVQLSGGSYSGFGANRNVYEKVPGGGGIHLSVADRKGSRMAGDVRLYVSGRSERSILHCAGVEVLELPRSGAPAADAVWLEGPSGAEPARIWELLGNLARDGGVLLISGAEMSFWEALIGAQQGEAKEYEHDVFEDFESGTYEGWTVEGGAFGSEPHSGTSPSQQAVSGFAGKRLVNTFVPNDAPQGRLLSNPFTIEKRYIGFLVGGGSYRGRTCVNLLVDDKVVRTTTGKNNELLEPASWDVAEFRGRTARIEIVDRESGAWGHVNVDQIILSDVVPELILAPVKGLEDLVSQLKVRLSSVTRVPVNADVPPPEILGVSETWSVDEATALSAEGGGLFDAIVEHQGVPLLVTAELGKARVAVALAKGLPASWGMKILSVGLKIPYEHGEGIDPSSRLWGDLSLVALGGEPTPCARWTEAAELVRQLSADGRLSGPDDSGPSPAGETFNAALAVPLRLAGGESKTVHFVLSWSFPNVDRFGHKGNKYSDWFESAKDVSAYVVENFDRLVGDTKLYHDTVYGSNLPYYAIDAATSQSVILRGPTCWWAREHKDTGKDYFAGYEGCYRCCPLNCTHVWNYAQSHARLFPEIGRNLRWYDFMHYLREDGETQHRQHSPHGAFIDGHCAVIEGAYREYLTSPDAKFLESIYPNVKKSIEWLIQKIDADEDGVNGGQQWNTYDVPTDGAHTFIGSQYLSALAAGERMALVVEDAEAAARWRKILDSGSKNQDEKLWNGEYWIQIPDEKPARDYNTGCHSDQLLGQWWAHMLGTGYLYPAERVKKALQSIYRYNFRQNFRGFQQRPRRYVLDDEAGMVMCSWPKGGRPDPFILYADEIWTGIEYEVAGLMIYEGLLDEGLSIVKAARDRYDGRVRQGLNSGPGGNPFNELECGKYYARALSSWSVLLASQGFVYEGPKGILGFQPRWQPQDHKSFFCAAEGWGLFSQRRTDNAQRDEIECRWGSVGVREIVLDTPAREGKITVAVNGDAVDSKGSSSSSGELRITIAPVVLKRGDRLTVDIPLK